MKGMEISKQYYAEFGAPMIEAQFGEVADRIAVGLVGEGSECLGFDDEISGDHDFELGFCLWITSEDERAFGFKLERAYAKLPREYMGLTRSLISPVGGNRRGVMTIDSFYEKFLGTPDIPDDLYFWLYAQPATLLSASNGEVWRDDLGEFSRIRETLRRGYPEDIRIKRLAANLVFAAQAGQYNYARCLEHGETGAAQLAASEFVRRVISCVYLLNNAYEPFYKWSYRGMRRLVSLSEISDMLEEYSCLCSDDSAPGRRISLAEEIASSVISELKKQGLTKATCNNLETHAVSITDKIQSPILRTMHIMEGG